MGCRVNNFSGREPPPCIEVAATFGHILSNTMAAVATTSFAELLRHHREAQDLPLRAVAEVLKVDISLVSKWERGERKPHRDEVDALAKCLKADRKQLLVAYLRDKVIYEVQNDEFALEALRAAEAQMKYNAKRS
jgi:transcriptional regulator with XRE-family HTH domain